MQNHEIRKILTLWAHGVTNDADKGRDWEVTRACHSLNLAINEAAQYVTLHSVSYMHVVAPGEIVSRVYATVVYSGLLPEIFGMHEDMYDTVYEANWS